MAANTGGAYRGGEKQLEEKYYGKLIYDFGLLQASEFVLENKYNIMLTERDNKYYIVIKHNQLSTKEKQL